MEKLVRGSKAEGARVPWAGAVGGAEACQAALGTRPFLLTGCMALKSPPWEQAIGRVWVQHSCLGRRWGRDWVQHSFLGWGWGRDWVQHSFFQK